jgi:hypothetical protein
MTQDQVNQIAERIVRAPAFRQLVREVALEICVENARLIERGAVQSFFQQCAELGIGLRLDARGRISPSERLPPDLRAVGIVYRDGIVAVLKDPTKIRELNMRSIAHGRATSA